jgi:hypothetical protein
MYVWESFLNSEPFGHHAFRGNWWEVFWRSGAVVRLCHVPSVCWAMEGLGCCVTGLFKEPSHSLVGFSALPDFLGNSGSGIGSAQPHEYSEELLGRNSSCLGLENREYGRGDTLHRRDSLYLPKVGTYFAGKRRSLGRYYLLADYSGWQSITELLYEGKWIKFSGTAEFRPRKWNVISIMLVMNWKFTDYDCQCK